MLFVTAEQSNLSDPQLISSWAAYSRELWSEILGQVDPVWGTEGQITRKGENQEQGVTKEKVN